MKVYVVYCGEEDSNVLFDGAYTSREAAQQHIDFTYTIPRRYAWDIQELETDMTDEERKRDLLPHVDHVASSFTKCTCQHCKKYRDIIDLQRLYVKEPRKSPGTRHKDLRIR